MSTPIIQLEEFRKTYTSGEMQVHAVRGVTLAIRPGEFVAIMGASGSGKSTMMNTLGCLDRPTSGRFLLDGVNVIDLNRDELADLRNQKIGFVFQGFNLLSRTTALENVELPMLYARPPLPNREQRERAMKALEMVGLGDRHDHTSSQLSGGQQQRVAIARALVNEPKIVFADEPTGNLDSHTGEAILGLFRKLSEQGRTIALVTHDPEIAAVTPRRIEIRDGKISRNIDLKLAGLGRKGMTNGE